MINIVEEVRKVAKEQRLMLTSMDIQMAVAMVDKTKCGTPNGLKEEVQNAVRDVSISGY